MSKTKSIYLISKAVWYKDRATQYCLRQEQSYHLTCTDKVVTIFGIQARTRSIQGDL